MQEIKPHTATTEPGDEPTKSHFGDSDVNHEDGRSSFKATKKRGRKDKAKKHWARELMSYIVTFGIAGLSVVLLLNFVFQSYQVSGESMEPTLQDSDRLVAWKLPRTWAGITNKAYIPNRGDIVIVDQKDLSACGQTGRDIVKRVIGLPGDTVVAGNNTLTVINAANPNGFQPDKTLAYGKNITEPVIQNKSVKVGAGQLFVAGDNRTNSCDSRFFGPINSTSILGKLTVRIIPVDKFKLF